MQSPERQVAVQAATGEFHLFSYLLGLLTALALLGGGLWLVRRPEPPPMALHPTPTPLPTATATATPTPAPIVVFVSGAVARPGLYALAPEARVGDAIAAAGGLLPSASGAAINQAERLWDGAQVHVPDGSQMVVDGPPAGVSGLLPTPTAAAMALGGVPGGRINLNTASAEELERLPGIGPSKAQAIIANRPYATVDDLERVPGIGAKTIDQLRDYVTAP